MPCGSFAANKVRKIRRRNNPTTADEIWLASMTRLARLLRRRNQSRPARPPAAGVVAFGAALQAVERTVIHRLEKLRGFIAR